MVCVPTSKGCATCLAKHVKCDETRPRCLRCQKAGRQCPGYQKSIIVKHYDPSGSRKNTFKLRTKQTSGYDVVRRRYNAEDQTVAAVASYNLSMSLDQAKVFQHQIMSTLTVAISPEWQILPPSQRYTGLWLHEIMDRTTKDTLLSLSMRALSCSYLGSRLGHRDMIISAHLDYTIALRKMQVALSNPLQDLSSIQSAAMLLTFFELLLPSNHTAWIQHAGGVARLMQIRGPAQYARGFDNVCYMAIRNHLISDAIISRKPCFLQNTEWQLTNEIAQEPFEQMFACQVELPGLLHDLRNSTAIQHVPSPVLVKALALREGMLHSFQSWLDSKKSPTTFPARHEASDGLRDHEYRFNELQSLILYCSHHASLIIINKIIIDGWRGDSLDLLQECHQAALEIGACVEQSRTSLLTSLSVVFWLQAALHGCAPSDAPWFERKMEMVRRKLV